MGIFIANIVMLGVWSFLFRKRLDPRQNGSLLFIVIISMQMIAVVACTPLTNDALNYELYASWHSYGNAEPGWKYFSEAMWAIYPDGKSLVLGTNAIITFAFGRYVWRNSRNMAWSYFIYICIGIWGMTFYILRQTIALAILLFAYEFVKKQKLLPFLLLVALASLFHQTALAFLLLYPVSLFNRGFVYHAIAVVSCFIVFVFGADIITFLLSVFRNGELYTISDFSGFSYFLMLAGFLVFASLANRRPEEPLAFHSVEIGVVLQTLSFYLSNFVRLVQYFAIHLTSLVPNAFIAIENTNLRLLLQVLMMAFMLFFYFIVQDCAYPDGSSNWYFEW